MPLQIG
jgi:hypothetical protein